MVKLILFLLLLPVSGYSQSFHFNNDGSSEPVSYATNKSAAEIYARVEEWIKKTFIKPEGVIVETKQNEHVLIASSFWNVFQRETAYDMTPKYKAYYNVLVEIKDFGYTLTYIHKEFKNDILEPVPFDLNSVLNGYCTYLAPNATENYEFQVNQLFEAISYFIENGKPIRRLPPLKEYPQMFRFNPDGSSNTASYTIDMTAEQLYYAIHSWVEKNNAFPRKMMTESPGEGILVVDYEDWNILEKEFDYYNTSKKRYGVRYSLEFKMVKNAYNVRLLHKEFLNDSDGTPVELTLSEVTGGKSENPDLKGGKEGYEYNINKRLDSLNQYLKTLNP